jgi:nucleotide-binding universal stress UspA family protein
MHKKILYPITFEELSFDILSCILGLKKTGMEEIVLLHIIDGVGRPEKQAELAETNMTQAVGIAKKAGIRVKKRIETGAPYKEILRVAAEEKASLIVSDRQRKKENGEIFIGSTTDKIIRYGNIPVYIPKYHAPANGHEALYPRCCERLFSRVLYPTDWSNCAEAALRFLIGLKEARIEEVLVAHVMDEKAMRSQSRRKFKECWELDRERLDTVAKKLQNEGLNAKTHIRIGKPNTDVIRIAREENASLVMMGSHGKGHVQGINWGSVARNVTEYSDRPVLLINDMGPVKKVYPSSAFSFEKEIFAACEN